jgi:hypothetical protein
MLKNKLWSAVRSLRGKKSKKPHRSQDDSDSGGSAEHEELKESELERRAKQWQSKSFLPKGDDALPGDDALSCDDALSGAKTKQNVQDTIF